jgi:hypothetical protein
VALVVFSILGPFGDCREIGTLLRAEAFRQGYAQAKQQQLEWSHTMKHGSAQDVIQAAESMLEPQRHILSPEQLAGAQAELAYLTTHADRAKYGEFRQRGYFTGSGVLEAGCKTVAGRRLKQSGMFWSHTGGDALLKLRCMTLGPNFDLVWQARLPILEAQKAKLPR